MNEALTENTQSSKSRVFEVLPMILFALTTLSLAFYELFRAYKVHYSQPELLFILAFSLWVLVVGILDIKTKQIPLWLTSPIIIASLILHILYPENDPNKTLIGFQLPLFDVALGIAFGFIMIDLVTHFGNWLAKYQKNAQGLLPLCVFVPVSIATFFIIPPTLPFWSMPLIVILVRFAYGLLYSKNPPFKASFETLLKNPLIIYSLFFVLIFIQACAVLYNKVESPFIKINYVVLALCSAFVLEEVIIPCIDWLRSKITKANPEKALEAEEDQLSVLGGGDASLTAALGALWGAIVINNCLLLAFFLAFILVGSYKLIVFLLQKAKPNFSMDFQIKEIPFAPFITLSAQVVLLAEILVKSPGATSCGIS
ncbi:MAG: prepilin peptidase [Candidatus Caenarcaniphilales bacterium]|nr:prepilin peptidase [Candidatus Caenarcaniphilales bacterium]